MIQPLRIFLDTNHLVNLTHLRLGRPLRGGQSEGRVNAYRALDEWLRTGQCVPVFCETMAYEWVRQKDVAAPRQIAAVFDNAVCTKRILPDPLIFIVEAMNECQRIAPEIGFPTFEVVRDLGPDLELVRWFNHHWPQKDEMPVVKGRRVRADQRLTVGLILDMLPTEVGSNDNWETGLKGDEYRLTQTRETQRRLGASKAVLNKVRRGWLKTALLLDQVIKSMNPSVDSDSVLARVRLENCPAVLLQVDAYWAYAKATAAPMQGDFVDLTMFGLLPHVDIALIEKRMHEFVRQVRRTEYVDRVFSDPVQLVESVSARI